ncbi:hypothetical protein [Candidatus Absconditicoccus praedator]|uniref:hypothetical protein n=1 Tax=Candidatus Absconditicoccus praedator TaxID=2735562 RepID=UPI001E5EBB0E|nr:hypothetical protein [Candidatus Absconditicoccus praedator]UFX82816.1 hypothetical protein HLG78_01620 [Candidatus Absconditicoccus praedator]
MKIFSNFDTNLSNKMFNKYADTYGKEDVMIVFKNNVFLALYVIIPLIGYLMFVGLWFYVGYLIDLGDEYFNQMFNYFLWIVFFISFLIAGRKIFKRFIDYEMDFALITPEEVVFYEQDGIFSRVGRTLNSSKIRSITVEKDGILRSLFNFGNVLFLAEGYHEDGGDIRIIYITDPDTIKYKAREILRKGSNPDVQVD